MLTALVSTDKAAAKGLQHPDLQETLQTTEPPRYLLKLKLNLNFPLIIALVHR